MNKKPRPNAPLPSYDRLTPETDAFILLLEDSEIDLSLVEARMKDIECERDYAREIAKQACALLAENNFEMNYPPMPWEEGSPENSVILCPPGQFGKRLGGQCASEWRGGHG